MKIVGQANIIEGVLEALKTNTHGIGISIACDINYSLNEPNSFIEFIPRSGIEIKTRDWFWLGYFVNQYVE